MRNVIKQKVHSALCNVDAVEAYNKNMYDGHRVEWDHDEKELVSTHFDERNRQRTHHGDI